MVFDIGVTWVMRASCPLQFPRTFLRTSNSRERWLLWGACPRVDSRGGREIVIALTRLHRFAEAGPPSHGFPECCTRLGLTPGFTGRGT